MARANGQGTLIKRGKYWTARWVVNGKVYTRTTKCVSKRDAEKKLAEFTKPFQENSEIDIIENLAAKVRATEVKVKAERNEKVPPLKILNLLDTYINDVSTSELRPSTKRLYGIVAKTLHDDLKKEHAHEVTSEDAKHFLEEQKKKKNSVATFNCYLRVLNVLFEVAMKHDYRIRKNVWEGFKPLKADLSQKRRELTNDEVLRLCGEAKKMGDEVGLLFLVAAYTGLRKSDCCNLQWSSIDMEKKLIKVLPIKTKRNGRYAILPLHSKLAEAFEAIKEKDAKYVMPKMKEAYENHSVENIIDNVFKNAGVEKSVEVAKGMRRHVSTGFHAFRHYFISNCVRQCIPVNVVQQMAAHSSASMSLAYSHVQESDLSLPNFADDTQRVTLKKSTVEALNKAKGVLDLDEFLMKLLEGKPATLPSHIKTKSDMELDRMLDELMPE